MTLSGLDEAIFRELQVDGRMPFTALAELLGVSETHIRRRVKSLIEDDVFFIAAVANPRLLGLHAMAWIGLVVRPSLANTVAAELVDDPNVVYVVIASGRFNVMVEVACVDIDDLYQVVLRLRAREGVQRCETFLYLSLARQKFQWGLGDRATEGTAWPRSVVDPRQSREEIDIDIIRVLQADGRASFRQIGDSLGVSERLVSSRYDQLVASGVLQVIAVANPATLGFRSMAWLGIRLAEGAQYDRVVDALDAVPSIDYIAIITGRYDIMVELVCRDRESMLSILEREVGAIDGIQSVETVYYLRLLYRSAAGAWGAARSRLSSPVTGGT